MSTQELEAVSDEALVAAYVAGDQRAFDLLVRRHQRRVYAICYRYFGDAADAEDAAQDAFLALLRRAETFTGASSFSTWMYRVATNACNDLARKRSRRPRAAAVEVADLADSVIAEDVIANRELGMELTGALRALDAEHREAIILHDLQGWPYPDIAERLGIPIGTVKSRVHRGHARMAAHLTAAASERPAERSAVLRPPTEAT